MTLPLLLGEAPSRAGDRYYHFPLSGAPAKRLCQFAGIDPQEEGSEYGKWYWALREHFDCLNAVERYADAYPWRVERARERVRAYLEEEPAEVVVALGVSAFDAVTNGRSRFRGTPWGKWVEVNGMRVAMLCHPSGRNRLLNDPAMRELSGRVLREAMNGEAEASGKVGSRK